MSIIFEKKDKIAYITINRPEAMNAMDPETYEQLSKAWIEVRDNPDIERIELLFPTINGIFRGKWLPPADIAKLVERIQDAALKKSSLADRDIQERMSDILRKKGW